VREKAAIILLKDGPGEKGRKAVIILLKDGPGEKGRKAVIILLKDGPRGREEGCNHPGEDGPGAWREGGRP
jgi:hypothetical protein